MSIFRNAADAVSVRGAAEGADVVIWLRKWNDDGDEAAIACREYRSPNSV
jgi:hypothetical protein